MLLKMQQLAIDQQCRSSQEQSQHILCDAKQEILPLKCCSSANTYSVCIDATARINITETDFKCIPI